MDRRLALVVLAAVGFVVLLAATASSGEVRLWHDAPPGSPSRSTTPPETIPPPQTTIPAAPLDGGEPLKIPHWIGVVLTVIIAVAALVACVLACVSAWRHRPRLRWRRDAPAMDFDVLPDVAGAMSADAADQRAALRRGAPRNAIVECWLRLEAVVADAGLCRDPADTSTEFTSRVLLAYTVDSGALLELSALYREARFSTHEMGEAQRESAIAALDALHEGLQAAAGIRPGVDA